jgi:phage-related protein
VQGAVRLLQQGENLGLPHSRPMPSIGQHCHELRIPDEKHNWRIMYFLDSDAIVILEVFAKTTPKTPKRTLEICQRRLKLYIQTLEVNNAKDKT